MLKIGEEVYVHGYIDEIRKDTIIIKNDGGYFGTVEHEIQKEIIIIRHGVMRKDNDDTDNKYLEGKYDALKALESLESEYKAYHTNSDYWRGVRYALDVIGGENDT